MLHSREITIEQSCLENPDAHNIFEYLKQLAGKVSVNHEEDKSFLRKQYEKITCISPSSILAKYLKSTALKKTELKHMPVFPFGFNLSQKAATEKALTEQISGTIILRLSIAVSILFLIYCTTVIRNVY